MPLGLGVDAETCSLATLLAELSIKSVLSLLEREKYRYSMHTRSCRADRRRGAFFDENKWGELEILQIP